MFICQTVLAGWASPRVQQEITHNRTANTYGGAGHNIALDLKCEHANKDFQGYFCCVTFAALLVCDVQ
jgi:hypothetical protein